MSKEIYVISTIKCSACKLMEHLLKCLQIDGYKFELIVIDIEDIPDFIKTNVPLNGFPTIVFVKDNVIKYHFTGTKSKRHVKRIIQDINF